MKGYIGMLNIMSIHFGKRTILQVMEDHSIYSLFYQKFTSKNETQPAYVS